MPMLPQRSTWTTLFAAGLITLAVCGCSLRKAPDAQLETLVAQLSDADAEVRCTAWRSAGPIGAKAVLPLAELMDAEDAEVVRAATAALREVAHHAAREGRTAPVIALLTRVALDATRPMLVRAEAVHLLGLLADDSLAGRKAVAALGELLADPQLAEDARMALERIPGSAATAALIGGLNQGEPINTQGLIRALGQRGDPAAVQPLSAIAQNAEPEQVACAMQALARIGVQARELFTLDRLHDAQATPYALPVACAYVDLAGQLVAAGDLDDAVSIYRALEKLDLGEHIRSAAMLGIGRTGDLTDLTVLLPAAAGRTPAIAHAAEAAMIALRDRSGGMFQSQRGEVNDKLMRLYGFAEPVKKSILLRVLVAREAEQAPQLLMQAARDGLSSLRYSAFEILARRGDPRDERLAGLLLHAAEYDFPQIREVAIRGLLRIAEARLVDGKPDEALGLYQQCMRLAPSDALRGDALQGLAWLPTEASIDLIEPHLVGPAAVPAGQALVAVASQMVEQGDPEAAIELLRDMSRVVQSPQAAEIVLRALAALEVDTSGWASQAGFITRWSMIGPFPNPTEGSAYRKVFFPETGVDLAAGGTHEGVAMAWRQVATDRLPAIFDLRTLFEPADQVTAYAYTEIPSDAPREVKLKLGSDDGVVVWLNGEELFSHEANRGVQVDGDVILALLEPGQNRLLIKVVQTGGAWNLVVRLTDANDVPIVLP